MARKILFTEDSLEDLDNILEYIGVDNPAAAEQFSTALLDHIELLKHFPGLGVRLRRRHTVRKIVHSPVRIYYRFHQEKNLMEVLHFWHGARKIPRL